MPFVSLSKEECARHEAWHRERAQQLAHEEYVRNNAEQIFRDAIVIGAWEDWELLYQLYGTLRRHGVMNPDVIEFIELIENLRFLLWEQTRDGKPWLTPTFGNKHMPARKSPCGSVAFAALEVPPVLEHDEEAGLAALLAEAATELVRLNALFPDTPETPKFTKIGEILGNIAALKTALVTTESNAA